MPTPGSVVHQQLMDAYTEAQSRLEAEREKIAQLRATREGLNDDRSNALVALAQHYLPELTDQAIEATWSEVRPKLSNLLLQKEDSRRRVQEKLDKVTSEYSDRDQQFVELGRRYDQSCQSQQQIADQVQKRLQDDPQFMQLSDRAAVAEAALERAEANLEEIDQDAARKLPAYDSSTLFRYLHDRGFGTTNYSKRGFTRRMDRALARFIGYQKARQGYEFLRRTPDQMRQIIAEDRQALDTVLDELERRRDIIAAELGLPKIVRQTKSLETERHRLLEAMEQLGAKVDETRHQLDELESNRGPHYRDAVGVFREMLEKHDSHQLQQRAAATSEPTDDQIVARLMGVEMDIEDLDDASRRQSERLVQWQEMIGELGRLIQKFRAAQFDTSRSHFVGSLDIMEEFDRALENGDIDHLWQRVRRAQRWGPTDSGRVGSAYPMTQVLVNAMSQAADAAKSGHARRAGHRRARRDSPNS